MTIELGGIVYHVAGNQRPYMTVRTEGGAATGINLDHEEAKRLRDYLNALPLGHSKPLQTI